MHEDSHTAFFPAVSPTFHISPDYDRLRALSETVDTNEDDRVQLFEEVEAQLPEINPVESVPIEEFIERHGFVLDCAADAWSNIAATVRTSRCDESVEKNFQSLQKCCAHNGIQKSDDFLLAESRKLAKELSIHELKVARYRSCFEDRAEFERRLIDQGVYVFHDKFVEYVHRPTNEIKDTRLARIGYMATEMEFADSCAEVTLEAFIKQYEQSPAKILELSSALRANMTSDNARLREFTEMIRVDWSRPDVEHSLLRRFMQTLSEDPERFVRGFVREVLTEQESVTRWPVVAAMAQFAVQVAAEQGVTLTSAEALASTRTSWGTFEAIGTAFESYTARVLQQIEKTFNLVVQDTQPYSIRSHVTREDIIKFNNSIHVHGMSRESRADRRKRKHEPNTTSASEVSSLEKSVEDHLIRGHEEEPVPRTLYGVSRGQGIWHTKMTDIETLLTSFKITEKRLRDDMSQCIELLLVDPMNKSHGSKLLKPARQERVLLDDNTQVNVRIQRFAPNDVVGKLQIHPDNRFMRIVYASIPGRDAVCILDIITHDELDKKY